MQDNYDNGVDQSFVDRGWDEMRRLLDREMPAAPASHKPSRRILPLWQLAAACISAILLGGVYLWNTASPGVAPPQAEAGRAIRNYSPAMHNNNSDAGCDDAPAVETESIAAAHKNTGGNFGTGKSNFQLVNDGVANALEEFVYSKNGVYTTPDEGAGRFANQPVTVAKATMPTPTVHAVMQARSVMPPFEMLSGVNPKPLDDRAFAMEADANKMNVAPDWLPDDMALSSGVIAGNFAMLEGFQVGIDARYALGGKWSLVSSPAYRFQRQELSLQVESAVVTTGSVTLDGQFGVLSESAEPNSNLAGASTYFTLLKNHYVDVPVQIGYQVGARFRLEAGPSFSYLAGVYEGSPTGSALEADMQQNYISNPDSRSWYSAAANDKLDPVYFNRLDVGLNLGFTYRPAQWLGLRLQYRQGFVDMLKTQAYELHNRQLALSTLVYF